MRPRRGHPPRTPWIAHTTELRVRFHEVDSLGIAWHGHYLAWFEVGREALGRAFGLGYAQLVEAGLVAPVVHACIDYARPARHGEILEILARLHRQEAARIDLSYEARRDGELLARGHTTQVFTRPDGELLLEQPPILRDFYRRHADRFSDGPS